LMVAMNGIEFRTRHNDYKLRMPSPDSSDYGKLEEIPFPKVPNSVLRKQTVDEQIEEMREYFRAFQEQNTTIRDYRPYFKPNLCYVEGAYTTGKSFSDPFESDRHAIDADSWFDLMDKIRFTSYTGTKSVDENFAFLPTNIMSVDDKGMPNIVQWNYRIICHPLKDDLPTKYFQQEDDLTYRFPQRATMDKVKYQRAQRYRMNYQDADHYSNGRSVLDDLMMQVPGKNNYPAQMYDSSFGMVLEDVRYNNHTLINSGYYHRYFKTMDKGAMGIKSIMRGYNDANLWVAQTTHPEIAPISVEPCERVCDGTGGHRCHQECTKYTARVSYALPLEVVYLTPLQTWNPYDLPSRNSQAEVTNGGKRNGAVGIDTAFNGTMAKKFHFITPAEFYEVGGVKTGPRDPADTAKNGAGVIDKNGDMKIMTSSGIRIVTPEIPGVGQVRLRYPIMPIHGEGSGVWKELNALKDLSMHQRRFASLYEERPGSISGNENGTMTDSKTLHFKTSMTYQDPPGEHAHDIFINELELEEIKQHTGDKMFVFTTSEDMGHSHELSALRWDNHKKAIIFRKCDGISACWDGHSNKLTQV